MTQAQIHEATAHLEGVENVETEIVFRPPGTPAKWPATKPSSSSAMF